MTNKERQARFKARQAEAGLMQLNHWVPEAQLEDLKRLAKLLCDNPDLELASAPLRSISTGRVVKC